MDEREQQRKIKHRLNVLRHAEEVTGKVAQTCRYFGTNRPRSTSGAIGTNRRA